MKHVLIIALIFIAFAAPSGAVTPAQLKRAEKMEKDAIGLMKKENYKEAISLLEEVLTIKPMDKRVSRYLVIAKQRMVEPFCKEALAAYREGFYKQAIEQWEKLLKMDPDDIRAELLIDMTKNFIQDNSMELLYEAVDGFLKEEKYEQAIKELEKILSIKPDDKRARKLLISSKQAVIDIEIKKHYKKAELYMQEENYDLAIAEWQEILYIDEKQEAASRLIASARRTRMDSMYDKAKKLYEEGNYIASRDLYGRILKDNPTDEDLKKKIGRLNETIKIVQRLSDKGKAWDMLRKALSNHIATNGNIKAAIAGSWYAVQLDPDNTVATSIRDFLERTHLAVFRTMEAPGRDMNIIDQYLFAALNHIYEGRYDLAIEECSIVLALQPEDILAMKRLGSAYFAMGKKDKAREAWQKALELSPEDKELKQFIKQSE